MLSTILFLLIFTMVLGVVLYNGSSMLEDFQNDQMVSRSLQAEGKNEDTMMGVGNVPVELDPNFEE
jgi:hypothetical protein